MKKARLKQKTRLKPITRKTADRNAVWRDVCLWRINYLIGKYGLICEYCGKRGSIDSQSLWGVWGHHIDKDRNNTDFSNCYIVHHKCHTEITDKNIQVSQEDFRTRELF